MAETSGPFSEKVGGHTADRDGGDRPVKKSSHDTTIWLPIRHRRMSDEEYRSWEEKGMYDIFPFLYQSIVFFVEDIIQLACAEAEMQRWSEQVSIKHAEFHRAILYFKRLGDVWTTVGNDADKTLTQMKDEGAMKSACRIASSRAVCARRTAAINKDLKLRMERAFK
jgi:hypothetical protein